MFGTLKVGDRIRLSGGYDMEPKWLAGNDCYFGAIIEFILGQNQTPAAVVKLDQPIIFDDTTSDIVILELRYEGSKWSKKETVHIELCDFMPQAASWKSRKQGNWVESHATYVKV
ncbi:MAG TPA: hypothetical protein VGJ90_13880 [Methylophilaceae bacterium]|jgi:hypothetical protein